MLKIFKVEELFQESLRLAMAMLIAATAPRLHSALVDGRLGAVAGGG